MHDVIFIGTDCESEKFNCSNFMFSIAIVGVRLFNWMIPDHLIMSWIGLDLVFVTFIGIWT